MYANVERLLADRVMQTRNNYGKSVFNGNQVVAGVRDVDDNGL